MRCAASMRRADGRFPSTCAPDSDPPADWHLYQCQPPATDSSLTISPPSEGFLHRRRRPPKDLMRGKGDCQMKLTGFVITAAVFAGLSGPAFAQGGSGQQTNPPVNQPVANTSYDDNRNWIVSGFIGTNFGASRTTDRLELVDLENFDSGTTSATFGGQVAYLGRGVIGGEFLAEFSPSIGTFNNLLFQD